MKRSNFILFLAIFLLASLFSCSKLEVSDDIRELKDSMKTDNWDYTDSDDRPLTEYSSETGTIGYYNNCIYTFGRTAEDKPVTFVRVNLETGIITNVCSDPLCKHNTVSCPFFGNIESFSINGNTVYYWRLYIKKGADSKDIFMLEFCTYDLDSQAFKIHSSESVLGYGLYSKMLIKDEYCYMYATDYDEEAQEYLFSLKKLNTKTSKIEGVLKLDEENSLYLSTNKFLFIINDRIYFQSPGEIYSTDLDFGDKQTVISGKFTSNGAFTNGEYIFYGRLDESGMVEKLHRITIDGKNDTDLGITTTMEWYITSKYIYYFTPPKSDTIPSSGKSSASVSIFYDKVMRCDHNGENSEIVFEAVPSEGSGVYTYYQFPHNIVVGNYIFTDYYCLDDKNQNGLADDGEYSNPPYTVIRIDIENQALETVLK